MFDPNVDEYVRLALIRSTNELTEGASDSELQDYLSQYDENQATGIVNNVKGIAHEMMYVDAENSDWDMVTATIQESTNHPGGDVILTNNLTGMKTDIQLKDTNSVSYINEHYEKYPDIDLLATTEVAEKMGIESTGISNEWLTSQVESSLADLGLDQFDVGTSSYIATVSAGNSMLAGTMASDGAEVGTVMENTFGEDLGGFLNAGLAGGYIGYLELLQDNPVMQKKVMHAGLALGVLDGFIGLDGLEDQFDINPLFIASVAVCVSKMAANSNSKTVKAFGTQFNYVADHTLKIATVGGYSAAILSAIDIVTPGVDIIDSIGDLLGIADVIDDLASGLIAFVGGRYFSQELGKWMGVDVSKDEVQRLKAQLSTRKVVQNLLISDVPAPLLLGPVSALR